MSLIPTETWLEMKGIFAAAYPNEATVAVWTDLTWRELENVHPEPSKSFKLTSDDNAQLMTDHAKGKLLAFLHSHPNGNPFPSDEDSANQIASDWTWGIVALKGNLQGDVYEVRYPEFWGDKVPAPALLGRQYLWGIRDCFSLVRDCYAEAGVKLRNVIRAIDPTLYPDNHPQRHLFKTWADLCGFKRVERHERQPGDAFTMNWRSREPNHCGIYQGEGKYLHQLRDRASEVWIPHNEERVLEQYAAQFYRLKDRNAQNRTTRYLQKPTS